MPIYKKKKVAGLREILCVVPHANDDIGFIFKAVVDESEFDRLSPYPKPRMMKSVKTGLTEPDLKDPLYIRACHEWGERKTHWMILNSMKDTPDWEWERVKLDDAGTWHLWRDELKEAGFNDHDILRMITAFNQAQGLDEELVQEARKRFLASSQPVDSSSPSPTDGDQNTPSGEPAKDSASGLPESK